MSVPRAGGARAGRAFTWRSASASAALLVIFFTATAVSSALLLEVHQDVTVFAREATPIPGIKNVLDEVPAGEPQTILLLGSDRRYGDGKGNPPRSDTIIVVRLEPDKNATAVMSLPRDLKVTIPGHGTDKINQRLPRRRAEAHGQDRAQPAGHPDPSRHQRELRRLLAGGQPPGLRLRRHRPALLQRQLARRELRDDRPQARLPEALRPGLAGLRALPPRGLRTSCAPRASRSSCARRRSRSASASCSAIARSS